MSVSDTQVPEHDTPPWWCPHWMEQRLEPWLYWWHGRPAEDHQFLYYRCRGCRRLVSWHGIRKGGCPCKLDPRLAPVGMTLRLMLRVVLVPWWRIVR
jgi:hypothetical protein